jgi:hypothetical protein
MQTFHELQANQFRIAAANNYTAPNAIPQNYKEAVPQGAAVRNARSPPRETAHPQEGEGEETLETPFFVPGTPTGQSRTTQPPFTPLLTRETSAPAREIRQPSGVIIQNLEPFVSYQALSGGDSYSEPVEVVTVDPSDIVGPSAPSPAPQGGGSLSKRRKASLNAVFPTAKRSRRVPQPSVPENIGTQVDTTDESLGFVSLNQRPEVQKAMRNLVVAIRASQFFIDNKLEPNIGTHEGVGLMAGGSDELWRGYGTKAKSIYSLFIKVDGKECKCLWCGDVQKGKLQRAVGHFRAKHLGHEPFLCDDVHVGNEVW